jgi:hypothetical protein
MDRSSKVVLAVLLSAGSPPTEPVAVRHREGLVHGFLVLRTLEGKVLAEGDLTQHVSGDRVTARLRFQFKDGSIHDDTTVFSQRDRFRLLSSHLVQKGPAFPRPMEMTLDGGGQVTVRYKDDEGEEKTVSERLELAADVANGLVPICLKNVSRDRPLTSLTMVVATPKPRVVKLVITASGEDAFEIAGSRRNAIHYVVKVEIGGVSGLLAPVLGKEPPDSHVWIAGGETPAFVKSEGPLYAGGPSWRIELTSPVWPAPPAPPTER